MEQYQNSSTIDARFMADFPTSRCKDTEECIEEILEQEWQDYKIHDLAYLSILIKIDQAFQAETQAINEYYLTVKQAAEIALLTEIQAAYKEENRHHDKQYQKELAESERVYQAKIEYADIQKRDEERALLDAYEQQKKIAEYNARIDFQNI